MNITDVGHLTSDADEGEDKMDKAATRMGKKPDEIAKFFTKIFKENLNDLNILKPDKWTQASEYIKEQIELIKRLQTKGFTYETNQAVYFSVLKFPHYTKLARQDLADKTVGAREEVVVDRQKKHPADFALWFKLSGRFKNHLQHWPSPWGEGFPGWHLECSAMAMNTLGDTVDIHCGGVDHIAVHHTNEIAQSEAATGKQFVRYWLHGEFLTMAEDKMAKSEGNFLTLETLKTKGINPLAYRYLCLGVHYRSPLSFSWESLVSAQEGLNNLYDKMAAIQKPLIPVRLRKGPEELGVYRQKFLTAISDDLNMPQGLALAWEVAKSDLDDSSKHELLDWFDETLGLKLNEIKTVNIPSKVNKLVKDREKARAEKNWSKADEVRREIEKLGFRVEDSDAGPQIKAKR